MRLFKAWSKFNNFNGQDQVTVNWFVVGRPKPIAPYEDVIIQYDETDEEAWCDQLYINEFFTEAEITELRDYLLQSHQVELEVEELPLPVMSGSLSYGLILISGENQFYSLADEEGYNLSVSVLGHFDKEIKNIPTLLPDEDVKMGIRFVEILLKSLNVPAVEKNDLVILLNKIYDVTGYYIKKDKSKAERLSLRRKNFS